MTHAEQIGVSDLSRGQMISRRCGWCPRPVSSNDGSRP